VLAKARWPRRDGLKATWTTLAWCTGRPQCRNGEITAPPVSAVGLRLDGVVGLLRVALLALDGAVALTAVPGGVALAVGAEDERYPTDWLRRTPFRTYRVPGVLLSGLVGGSAALAATQLLRHGDAGAAWSVPAGVILVGWIGAEIVLLDQPDPGSGVELGYLAAGCAMVGLGLWASLRGATARATNGSR
jgi:hypothetical protein